MIYLEIYGWFCANNLKTLTIKFNKEVDSKTVIDDNVKVYIGTSTTAATVVEDGTFDTEDVKYTLAADKKTLTVEFRNELAQSTNVKVVVDGVKTVDGKSVEKFESTQTVTDTTFPTLESVQVLNSKTLVVKTSEPIKPLSIGGFAARSEVKVDGTSLPVKVTPNASTNEIVLEFGSKLSVGEHKLALSDFSDFANFKASAKEFTFSVVADTTAPEITGATAIDKNTVKITFSEPVDTLGTIDVNGVTTFNTPVWSADKKEVTLSSSSTLFNLGSTVESVIKYKGTKDVEGNEVKDEKKFVFKAADDTTKPTVSVNVKDGNVVEVTFSESLSATGTVTVKDKDGNVVVNKLAVPALDSNNKVTFSPSQLGLSDNGGNYTLEFEGAKDNSVRLNEMDKTTVSITAKDIKKPTASLLYSEAGKLTVQFDEAMDTATLSNPTNYIVDLDGAGTTHSEKYLSAIQNAEVKVAADAKSVTLVIPGATSATKVRVYLII